MKKYYDEWERQQLLKTRDEDPYLTLEKAKQYVSEYSDYMGYLTYAGLLIDLNKMSEAKEILDYVKPNSKIYNDYYKRVDCAEVIPLRYISELIRYYIYTEDYEKAYEVCEKHIIFLKSKIKHIYAIEAFLFDKLDMNDKIQNTGYLTSQIVDYSVDRFKEHISSHLKEDDIEYYRHKSIFSTDFPLDKVLEEILKRIPNENRLYFNCFVHDKYIFKFDNCGRMDGTIADFIEVTTLHGTNKLITMHPNINGEKYPHEDLNFLKDTSKARVRKMSQIEKFNKKYNL